LTRSGTRAKGTGTKGAGISDVACGAIRRAKRNPNSPSWSAALRSWSPKPSLLRSPAPRSGTRAKEAGTKGAGISDAARRASRRAKRNPNSPSWSAAVRSWSPKPSLLRSPGAPIRDANEGNGHKGSRNQRRGASYEWSRETQSEFATPSRRSQIMAPNALIPQDGSVAAAPQSIIAAFRMQTIVACAGFSLRLRIRCGISQR
jgi:hypothetical protein